MLSSSSASKPNPAQFPPREPSKQRRVTWKRALKQKTVHSRLNEDAFVTDAMAEVREVTMPCELFSKACLGCLLSIVRVCKYRRVKPESQCTDMSVMPQFDAHSTKAATRSPSTRPPAAC